ncbi:squamous cell carcinoma antigen recognized by cytotoxic t lymphocytes [Holotrichia oblita]|nr:squamous cell carcinoma antigen recognized by cytotoxic t lymphocytes [Holotrichia oblita]
MGSSSKKYKEKECRKRKHRSRSRSDSESKERDYHRERKHKHKKHHKEKKREKSHKHQEYDSHDSDVIEISPDRIPTPPPPKLDNVPESSGQSSESLSIDETNKLRAKLGLKPLEVSTDEKRADGKKKDDLGEFYHKPAANLSEKREQEKFKEKLVEYKEKRHIMSKLAKTKTLGESDSEEDVSTWVSKNRHVQTAKKQAEKRAKMLEELDAQFGVSDIIDSETRARRRQQYTERNLRGLQIEHDINDIAEERQVILTLKDQNVLDEGEDVLVNVNMLDNERYKKNIENLKKKALYNAYDDDELDEFGNPKEKTVLGKYDSEIDGEKRQSFRIGHDNYVERKHMALQNIKNKLANKRIESLSGSGLTLASEYYNEEELARFKKPKKKVRKIRAKGKLITADDLEQMRPTGIEDIGTRRAKKEEFDIDDMPSMKIDPYSVKFEEKEELYEKALEKAKNIKLRERIDVLSTVKSIKDEPMEEMEPGSNIVLNATAEFCRTLGDIPTYGKAGNRDEVVDDLLDFEKEGSKSDDDCQIISDDEGGRWNSVDPNEQRSADIKPTEVPILDEEPDVGSGVGAALKLAMSKGYLDKEQNNRPSNSRLAHLQAKHYSIEDKSYGDELERGGRRERYTGPVQEFKEKDTFKPNVKLEYIDDEGHVLNSKEAFRYLSHKFHGKGPGKNKIEKRLKKAQQEGLMKKMSSTDTPLGTLNMLQAKQKEMQSPYIVLSGGKHTHSTTISKQRR